MTKRKMKQWITVGVLTLAMLLTPLMEVRAEQTFSEIKISGDYDYFCYFSEGLARAFKWIDNGGFYKATFAGFINQAGEVVVESKKYDWADYFSEGLAVVHKDDKYGYIDKNVKEVIPCQYDFADAFSEGLALVRKDDKYGYIDKNGKEVIACQYESALSFSEGLAAVKKDRKWGYINRTGEEVIECKYGSIDSDYGEPMSFSEGIAWVYKDGKVGAINQAGEEVIAFQYGYESAMPFSEGLAVVYNRVGYGVINRAGEEVIACQYDLGTCTSLWMRGYDEDYQYYYTFFPEGLAGVYKDGKYGYINQNGEEVIACKYDWVCAFSEGLAVVNKDGKWGYINRTGEEVIECKYESAMDFSEGLAIVKKDGKYGVINRAGEEVIAYKYDDISMSVFCEGATIVHDPDKGWMVLRRESQIPVTSTVNNTAYGKVYYPKTIGIGETVTYQAQPYKGYNFDGWYRNGVLVSEQNPYSFVATADNTSLQAVFSIDKGAKTQIPVTSTVNNSVYGKVSCPSKVVIGEKVTYKALPSVGYKFDGWYRNGALVSNRNPYRFVASADNTNLQAVFSWDKSLNDDKLAKLAESSELPILLLEGHANKNQNQINLKWTNAGKNVYYEVYQSVCDGKANFIKVGTTQKNNFTIKNLNKKKAYKFFVAAYKKSGNDKSYVAKAISAHIALPGYAQTNVKSMSLKASSVTVKKGKTAKIKATATGENPKKKMVNHVAAFRYETSNKAIATVNKKGVIKGQKKGSCTIYVIANNGVHKAVKVRVK